MPKGQEAEQPSERVSAATRTISPQKAARAAAAIALSVAKKALERVRIESGQHRLGTATLLEGERPEEETGN